MGDELKSVSCWWWVVDLLTKGSKIFWSDCRVRGDTPASVRSPQAPLRRSKPCRRIITETRSPTVHQSKLRTPVVGCLPPIGSKGKAGKNQLPKMAKNATILEYASLR